MAKKRKPTIHEAHIAVPYDNQRFIEPATDFTGIEVKSRPYYLSQENAATWTICPKCKGHGYWNHYWSERGGYQRMMCGACWSWGWKAPNDQCPHEWVCGRNIGRCLHEWECKLCGKVTQVDSSD